MYQAASGHFVLKLAVMEAEKKERPRIVSVKRTGGQNILRTAGLVGSSPLYGVLRRTTAEPGTGSGTTKAH